MRETRAVLDKDFFPLVCTACSDLCKALNTWSCQTLYTGAPAPQWGQAEGAEGVFEVFEVEFGGRGLTECPIDALALTSVTSSVVRSVRPKLCGQQGKKASLSAELINWKFCEK
eukprot:scaffold6243_cov15-Tisochrysis_lutea.AAC.2